MSQQTDQTPVLPISNLMTPTIIFKVGMVERPDFTRKSIIIALKAKPSTNLFNFSLVIYSKSLLCNTQ